jgi:hypothetical protein
MLLKLEEQLLLSSGGPVVGLTTLLDMLQQYAFSFYEVAAQLEKLLAISDTFKSSQITYIRSGELSECLAAMRRECEAMGLDSTSDLISHTESDFQQPGAQRNNADTATALQTISRSFSFELRKHVFFRIAEDKLKFFQRNDLFGPEVSNAFPSCADDVRNAGTCYATEQWNACVFNLMTVLGRGLDVMAKKFGVNALNANWHSVIERIEAEVRKIGPGSGADWKEQKQFHSEAAAQFMFLKEAWRNHIMHGRAVYDEGTSLSILDHVRQVMQSLAKGGLSE